MRLNPFFVALFAVARSHFVLWTPKSIGYNDATEATPPCDGFDIHARTPLIQWPVAGYPVALISTHTQVKWQLRVALLNNTDNWVDLIPDVSQTAVGNFCWPSIPGIMAWMGLDAVVQIIQTAPDGMLYQVSALSFFLLSGRHPR
jgi:hypothetical protein